MTATALRVITDRNLWPKAHLASLQAMWRAIDERLAPPTLLLRTLSPCVLIGATQNVADAIFPVACRERNIPIFRRFSEGGAVVLDPGCLVFSLLIPSGAHSAYSETTALEKWCLPILSSLGNQGIHATFSSPNDIRVSGRKLCGTTLTVAYSVIAFSGTLLVNMPTTRYDSLFPVSPDNARGGAFSQKAIVLEEILKTPVSVDRLMDDLAREFARALGWESYSGEMNAQERASVSAIEPQIQEWA